MVSADSVRSIKLRSRPQRRNSKLQNQIESLVPKAARRVENEDRFWVIEGVEDEIVKLADVSIKHTVLFRDCRNVQVHLKQKCNSVQMYKLKHCQLLGESVISSVDLNDCESCQVQIQKRIPTLTLEKSENSEIYLPWASRDVQVFSSGVRAVQLLVPSADPLTEPDWEWERHALPEQFQHAYNGSKFVTQPAAGLAE
ncbi:MAG: hypothetical protein KVP17_000528 [Porospora cf. gigantea B]|uniref:uncharacterized protein n=1 Tax=Porospora cf. gigantea B TaxID=2853592 RepID=UPI0035718432|nr:MAG: hypothetical protein KVP17_000528 [Porospora cf. gigantea B]